MMLCTSQRQEKETSDRGKNVWKGYLEGIRKGITTEVWEDTCQLTTLYRFAYSNLEIVF